MPYLFRIDRDATHPLDTHDANASQQFILKFWEKHIETSLKSDELEKFSPFERIIVLLKFAVTSGNQYLVPSNANRGMRLLKPFSDSEPLCTMPPNISSELDNLFNALYNDQRKNSKYSYDYRHTPSPKTQLFEDLGLPFQSITTTQLQWVVNQAIEIEIMRLIYQEIENRLQIEGSNGAAKEPQINDDQIIQEIRDTALEKFTTKETKENVSSYFDSICQKIPRNADFRKWIIDLIQNNSTTRQEIFFNPSKSGWNYWTDSKLSTIKHASTLLESQALSKLNITIQEFVAIDPEIQNTFIHSDISKVIDLIKLHDGTFFDFMKLNKKTILFAIQNANKLINTISKLNISITDLYTLKEEDREWLITHADTLEKNLSDSERLSTRHWHNILSLPEEIKNIYFSNDFSTTLGKLPTHASSLTKLTKEELHEKTNWFHSNKVKLKGIYTEYPSLRHNITEWLELSSDECDDLMEGESIEELVNFNKSCSVSITLKQYLSLSEKEKNNIYTLSQDFKILNAGIKLSELNPSAFTFYIKNLGMIDEKVLKKVTHSNQYADQILARLNDDSRHDLFSYLSESANSNLCFDTFFLIDQSLHLKSKTQHSFKLTLFFLENPSIDKSDIEQLTGNEKKWILENLNDIKTLFSSNTPFSIIEFIRLPIEQKQAALSKADAISDFYTTHVIRKKFSESELLEMISIATQTNQAALETKSNTEIFQKKANDIKHLIEQQSSYSNPPLEGISLTTALNYCEGAPARWLNTHRSTIVDIATVRQNSSGTRSDEAILSALETEEKRQWILKNKQTIMTILQCQVPGKKSYFLTTPIGDLLKKSLIDIQEILKTAQYWFDHNPRASWEVVQHIPPQKHSLFDANSDFFNDLINQTKNHHKETCSADIFSPIKQLLNLSKNDFEWMIANKELLLRYSQNSLTDRSKESPLEKTVTLLELDSTTRKFILSGINADMLNNLSQENKDKLSTILNKKNKTNEPFILNNLNFLLDFHSNNLDWALENIDTCKTLIYPSRDKKNNRIRYFLSLDLSNEVLSWITINAEDIARSFLKMPPNINNGAIIFSHIAKSNSHRDLLINDPDQKLDRYEYITNQINDILVTIKKNLDYKNFDALENWTREHLLEIIDLFIETTPLQTPDNIRNFFFLPKNIRELYLSLAINASPREFDLLLDNPSLKEGLEKHITEIKKLHDEGKMDLPLRDFLSMVLENNLNRYLTIADQFGDHIKETGFFIQDYCCESISSTEHAQQIKWSIMHHDKLTQLICSSRIGVTYADPARGNINTKDHSSTPRFPGLNLESCLTQWNDQERNRFGTINQDALLSLFEFHNEEHASSLQDFLNLPIALQDLLLDNASIFSIANYDALPQTKKALLTQYANLESKPAIESLETFCALPNQTMQNIIADSNDDQHAYADIKNQLPSARATEWANSNQKHFITIAQTAKSDGTKWLFDHFSPEHCLHLTTCLSKETFRGFNPWYAETNNSSSFITIAKKLFHLRVMIHTHAANEDEYSTLINGIDALYTQNLVALKNSHSLNYQRAILPLLDSEKATSFSVYQKKLNQKSAWDSKTHAHARLKHMLTSGSLFAFSSATLGLGLWAYSSLNIEALTSNAATGLLAATITITVVCLAIAIWQAIVADQHTNRHRDTQLARHGKHLIAAIKQVHDTQQDTVRTNSVTQEK